MKEIPFQTLCIKAVKAAGGWGIKLSNRFLVGVPDLLVVFPDTSTMLVEAKWNERCPGQNLYSLELTPKQAYTLRAAAAGGMVAGAISLLTCKKQFGVKTVPIDRFEGGDTLRISTLEYTWCNRSQLDAVVVNSFHQLYAQYLE